MSRERSFRTLPGGDAPFRFLDGGDMGVTGAVVPLMTLAGKQNPDFAVIGGDIAYVNGLLGGLATWDTWLSQWDQHMVTTDGRMIPIVATIGNHEVNQFKSDDLRMRAPWYTSLFGRQGPEHHHVKRFGTLLALFLLDSGHLVSHESQVPWLRRAFEQTGTSATPLRPITCRSTPPIATTRAAARAKGASSGCRCSTSSG